MRMKTIGGVEPWKSDDPDTNRIWWRDGGVHQNITHAVPARPNFRSALLATEGFVYPSPVR